MPRLLIAGAAAVATASLTFGLVGCGDQLPTDAQLHRRIDVAALDVLLPSACKAVAAGDDVKGHMADIKRIARNAVKAAALDPNDVIHTADGDVTLKDAVMNAFANGCQAEKDALNAALDAQAASKHP